MTTATVNWPEVYIFCHECDGFWFWSVDRPGLRQDIRTNVYLAYKQGDRVVRVTDGTRFRDYCKCNGVQK